MERLIHFSRNLTGRVAHSIWLSTTPSRIPINEKNAIPKETSRSPNPVIESSEFAHKVIDLVQIDDEGVKNAAQYIRKKLLAESYTPRTWRTHPLHICPPEPYDPKDPLNKEVLNWIFLISALNFSFWSEKEGRPDRYGVQWLTGWKSPSPEKKVWTGYWSLVAALDRALEEAIPITDPHFYSSEESCPDSLIEYVFRPAEQSSETIPLIRERIAVMREVGRILCDNFGGSYLEFIENFQRQHDGQGTGLDLVKIVVETFPPFRDEADFGGRRVCLWKRAQILVAETWAAFYPEPSSAPHPIFPGRRGPEIHHLTMFADYRIPQILHHLRIITYPASLISKLEAGAPLASGSPEEVSLRATSIIAVERVREEILRLIQTEGTNSEKEYPAGTVSSVLIDFYLWDLAKRVEGGVETIEGIATSEMVPIHRTRSIWY
ncbi:hypothetical protein BDQ12DRAFT_679988 [Crucibulum laeve]|uniref:Queuosine 5'-phosphate N-glycosylase/hydrolase n=1 Tax=Crucibulum laeve TaxID=68775 RepID=A0A5C3M5Q4_9AGAR|nr:hypothetical protein BDQ12DRAFT_679988 [Crucibulum laeve]